MQNLVVLLVIYVFRSKEILAGCLQFTAPTQRTVPLLIADCEFVLGLGNNKSQLKRKKLVAEQCFLLLEFRPFLRVQTDIKHTPETMRFLLSVRQIDHGEEQQMLFTHKDEFFSTSV